MCRWRGARGYGGDGLEAMMSGKLYRVTVEVEMLCYGESRSDAEDVALENIRDASCELERADVNALAVDSLTEDEGRVCPWGGPGALTCAEILEGK